LWFTSLEAQESFFLKAETISLKPLPREFRFTSAFPYFATPPENIRAKIMPLKAVLINVLNVITNTYNDRNK